MNNKINPINIILIILIPIVLLILIAILFFYNINKTENITATIKYKNEKYIIVKEINKEDEYILKTNTKKLNINDTLKLTLYKINNNTNPKEAAIKRIEIIEEENNNKEIKKEEIIEEEKYTEEDINNYFDELNNSIDNYQEDKTLIEKIKTNFKKIVDFLFYDEEINGIKFNELSTNTKLKILKTTMQIDNKINKILPDYKENLSDKYKNIKSKIIEKYLNITTDICEKKESTCQNAKEGLKELKNSFNVSWTYIKNIGGIELNKLKKWYEVWRDAK